MRLCGPGLLLALASPAYAAPTPEEQALEAALAGRNAQAVSLLGAEDPHQRWLAGRLALASGDLATAARLLAGDSMGSVWGRIDLAERRGDPAGAATLALAEMGRALGGVHRDALGELLVSWAAERAPKDPQNAAQFLVAALGLGPGDTVRHAAEDALFRLPTRDRIRFAPRRIREEPTSVGARLAIAVGMAGTRTGTAATMLAAIVHEGGHDDALLAATALTSLDAPPPLILAGLAELARRFPEDAAALKLRIAYATTLSEEDEALGTATLASLVGAPPRVEVLRAQAKATSNPLARRGLWLRVAGIEGASAGGDEARAQALAALIEAVKARPEAERIAAAKEALAEPDGAGVADLMYLALPTGAARVDALWAHAARFPTGPWCDELADALLTAGADADTAARYQATCTGGGGHASLLGTTPTLVLAPATSGVDVLVSNSRTLQVSQHRVDPEALFRASAGNPLDTTLDAWLLDPDQAWEVEVKDAAARRLNVAPRGKDALVTLTVRAEDQRATAFVVGQPLEVQLAHVGEDLAVGVLRAGVPTAGTTLLVQDGLGAFHDAKTGADGLVVLHGIVGEVRVMARKGDALGFATAVGSGTSPVADTWAVQPWQRTVATEGAWIDVEVIGSAPNGPARAPATLESYTPDGALLQSVPVLPGVSHQHVFAVGDGYLRVTNKQGVLTTQALVSPARAPAPAVLWWSPAEPPVGTRVTAHLAPLAAPALSGTWTVGDDATTGLLDREVTVPVDLAFELDAARYPLGLRLPDGGGIDVDLQRRSAEGPRIDGVPSLVAGPFTPHAPAGTWVRASSGGAVVWARAGEALTLREGTWSVAAWDGRLGDGQRVVVAAKDRWVGAPVLVADSADGIRRVRWVHDGEVIPGAPLAGTTSAWANVAAGELPALRILGDTPVDLDLHASLTRGGTSSVSFGDGLPSGTKLWVVVQDATSVGPLPTGPAIAPLWAGDAGAVTDAWSPVEQDGTEIAAGLLAEEERVDEEKRVERLDYEFSPAAEEGAMGGIGLGGMGSGGGGYGSASDSANGYIKAKIQKPPAPIYADPAPLAVFEAVAPGTQSVTVPAWIASADIQIVAALPDGRWASDALRVAVDGPTPIARPVPVEAPSPTTWDGQLASLLPLARELDGAAAVHALAALEARGLTTAHGPRVALRTSGSDPEAPLTRRLLDTRIAPGTDAELDAIPDVRRAQRAEAALALADRDPERARATAQRLLQEPVLEPYARVRAGLALWITGDAGALPALAGEGPALSAARAIVSGKPDTAQAPGWWTLARNEAAAPAERALAIHALTLVAGKPVPALPTTTAPSSLALSVQPPLATLHGQTFARGSYDSRAATLTPMDEVPAGRTVPVWLVIPASPLPTHLGCPDGFVDLAPSDESRWASCDVVARTSGPLTLTWYDPDGAPIAAGATTLRVGAARDSLPADPMSQAEQLGLGMALAREGDPAGLTLLEEVMASTALPASELEAASTAVLEGRRKGGDPAALVRAFSAYREHVPGGALDLETAAALARAYAATGDNPRALAATRVVMDARFKEELGAVNALRSADLELTALKLLRELVDRYPEVPTVVAARFLAPSMLLARAEGDGDRLGYTRSSLRHTAAGELAAFLLLHPDAAQAPEAAVQLSSAVHALGDPARERLLAGPLARRFRDSAAAWRLSLAEARSWLAAGNAAQAERILRDLHSDGDEADIDLARGQAAEALGKRDVARDAYARSGRPEAMERAAWLDRSAFDLPPTLVLQPGAPAVVPANLRPGAELTVTAIRVNLESVLLRDNGSLDAGSIAVDGLRPAASTTLKVDPSGDVPLPSLPEGAYVVTVSAGGQSQRMVLVRTDAELVLSTTSGQGTIAHLADHRGAPLADAQLWVFDGSGTTLTARTDRLGAAFVASGGGTVLARAGDRYALAMAAPRPYAPAPYAEPLEDLGYMEKNNNAYNQLFDQEARQKVQADML